MKEKVFSENFLPINIKQIYIHEFQKCLLTSLDTYLTYFKIRMYIYVCSQTKLTKLQKSQNHLRLKNRFRQFTLGWKSLKHGLGKPLL